MYEQTLVQAGLTQHQATIYELLLTQGQLPAGKIAKKSSLKRGLVYKILDELVEFGLVEKNSGSKITQFSSSHPLRLKEFIEKREQETKNAQMAVNSILPSLVSDFSARSNKPGIRFFAGTEGLRVLYDDILTANQPIFLFRAAYDPAYTEKIKPIVEPFIANRIKQNLSVDVIAPKDELTKHRDMTPEADARNLMSRTWITPQQYTTPVEINIYGDRVAFLSFGSEFNGFSIQSAQVAKALHEIFLLAKAAGTSNTTDRLNAGKIPRHSFE